MNLTGLLAAFAATGDTILQRDATIAQQQQTITQLQAELSQCREHVARLVAVDELKEQAVQEAGQLTESEPSCADSG